MAASSTFSTLVKRLQGKVALVTGGASGIGEGSAKLFARHGANVVIADVQSDLGHSVSEEIRSECGDNVVYVPCDVTKESDVENAVNTAVSKYGKLDIMFNNAGVAGKYSTRILSFEDDDFKKVFNVNVYGAFLGAKHAARVMIPERKGSIIFTASVASVIYGGTPHPYSASKHAVVGLTKNLAVELGEYGIRANCLSPSGIPTPLAAKAMGGVDLKTVQEVSMAMANLKGVKMGVDDVAQAALYLASDESKFISGLNLVVDGAFSLKNSGLGFEAPDN